MRTTIILVATFLRFVLRNRYVSFFLKGEFLCEFWHCFICCLLISTVSEDAGIEPRTVATILLAVIRFKRKARSYKGMLNKLELLCRLPRKQEHLCVEQLQQGGGGPAALHGICCSRQVRYYGLFWNCFPSNIYTVHIQCFYNDF